MAGEAGEFTRLPILVISNGVCEKSHSIDTSKIHIFLKPGRTVDRQSNALWTRRNRKRGRLAKVREAEESLRGVVCGGEKDTTLHAVESQRKPCGVQRSVGRRALCGMSRGERDATWHAV